MLKILEKIKEKLGDKFVKVCLAFLVLIFVVWAAKMLFLRPGTPTLTQVLSQKRSFDPSLFLASVLSFSFAALSLAKGYEIVRRNRAIDVVAVSDDEPDSLIMLKDQEIDDLKESIKWLQDKNMDAKGEIRRANAKLDELTQMEKMLRGSNISLGKECERLRADLPKTKKRKKRNLKK